MPIRHAIVSRDDSVYECFPDVARTRSGRLLVIYRESDGHQAREFCRLVVRASDDEGETWGARTVLVATVQQEGVLLEYNCPRVVQLRDGRLLALCDAFPIPPGEDFTERHAYTRFWWNTDDGVTWSPEPLETPVMGVVPDRVVELSSGVWLLGSHERLADSGVYRQMVYRSTDAGRTWEGPTTICATPEYEACEGSILPLPDGTLVCYMRENSGRGLPALKCLSRDEGRTWEGPYLTLMDGCHRPVAGLLPSGQVLVTYRHQPGGAGYWAKNLFAYRETVESALEPQRARQRGIVLPLDHDRSEHSDSGYSGWVVLPSGTVFAVQYINDDAPLAHIRSYWFTEEDF